MCDFEFVWCFVGKYFFYFFYFYSILIGLVLFFCLVGISLDMVIGFMKLYFMFVNKSDGFMLVSGVFMVMDYDIFSDSLNLIYFFMVFLSLSLILLSFF